MTESQASGAGAPLIEAYALGPFATNCFLVHTGHGGEGWIVDASFEPGALIERARELELEVTKIVLTHAHGDHIAGLHEVRAAFPGARVVMHEKEASWLGDPVLNLSAGFGEPVRQAPAEETLKGGEVLKLGDSEWKVLHTPGHSPGMVALYCAAVHAAIVSDTLFAGSVGRFDFPTSNEGDLMRSLGEVLMKLPDDTRVLPGHGPATTIGRERKFNPYLATMRG